MTNSHFSKPDEPALSLVLCDGCGKFYDELAAVVWGRKNGLIKRLLCLECAPEAKNRPNINITQAGKRYQ